MLQVRFSPFLEGGEAFLTCSTDWTVRLWSTRGCGAGSGGGGGDDREECALKAELRSSDLRCAVNDVAWSPTSSTLFALAADDGRVEFWDLERSVLDPVLAIPGIPPPKGASAVDCRCTSIMFGEDGRVLVAGFGGGNVSVYVLPIAVTKAASLGREEQANRLNRILFPNGK